MRIRDRFDPKNSGEVLESDHYDAATVPSSITCGRRLALNVLEH